MTPLSSKFQIPNFKLQNLQGLRGHVGCDLAGFSTKSQIPSLKKKKLKHILQLGSWNLGTEIFFTFLIGWQEILRVFRLLGFLL